MRKAQLFTFIVTLVVAAFEGWAESRAKSAGEVMERLKDASLSSATTAEFCTRPGAGKLGIVSMQTLFGEDELRASAEQFARQLKFPVSFAQVEGAADIQSLEQKMGALGLDMAFFVVDETTLPMSLISLEQRWGVINAKLVLEGNPEGKARSMRLRRVMARVFKALLCSGSTVRGVSAVRTGKDLEALPADPIEAASLMQMINSLQSFGLRPPRTVPYYRACKEGWAPAPTNEYQKAIWDKVHAIPAKPMKIEFDPKKGR